MKYLLTPKKENRAATDSLCKKRQSTQPTIKVSDMATVIEK
jgi:hypothetical protein